MRGDRIADGVLGVDFDVPPHQIYKYTHLKNDPVTSTSRNPIAKEQRTAPFASIESLLEVQIRQAEIR